MTDDGRYHGGLVFFGFEDTFLARATQSIADTFEDYGHPVARQSVINDCSAQIAASHYDIELTVHPRASVSEQQERARRLDALSDLNRNQPPSSDVSARLQIDIRASDVRLDDTEISELLLVVILYRLVDICQARSIEWLSPDTTLTLNQFLSVFSSPLPLPEATQTSGSEMEIEAPELACGHNAGRAHASLETQPAKSRPGFVKRRLLRRNGEQALAQAFRTAPDPVEMQEAEKRNVAQSDLLRLASWGMTGMLLFLSVPVCAAMTVVNLIRGEDFRMNAQVLTLTSLLVAVQSTGAFASILALLPM